MEEEMAGNGSGLLPPEDVRGRQLVFRAVEGEEDAEGRMLVVEHGGGYGRSRSWAVRSKRRTGE